MPKKLGYKYAKGKVAWTLPVNRLGNLGFYENTLTRFKKINFRLDKRLADLKKWKFVEGDSGSTKFKLPNGQLVIVKPEVWVPFPPMKVGKRQSNYQPRKMLSVMNELMRRGVEIDAPLGELIARERVKRPTKRFTMVDRVFYITKVKKGKTFEKLYFEGGQKEVPLAVAKSMADFLVDMHKKGVIHGHPHERNWLIDGNKAELVDSKGVSFKEEYPWKANTGRVHTFEEARIHDLRLVEAILPVGGWEMFLREYAQRMAPQIRE